MELNWKEWEGKKAYILLSNGYEYNCIIDCVWDEVNGETILEITDKFGAKKIFAASLIKFVEERR